MDQRDVFYTCEWAIAMQSAYKASLPTLLFLGYEGDDLVGVASLAMDVAEENVTFLAATTADYCDGLTHPRRRDEFVDAVFAELGKIKLRLIALASVPEDSATPAPLRAAAEKNRFHF